MKKTGLLILAIIVLCSLYAFADSDECCDKAKQKVETNCPQTSVNCLDECFLCTEKNMKSVFSGMNLSNAQICNAQKIQEKYEQEVYSIEEKIQSEIEKLTALKNSCSSKFDIHKQRRYIKNLEKTKKKICNCYQEEFKTSLSKDQEKIYNRNIK